MRFAAMLAAICREFARSLFPCPHPAVRIRRTAGLPSLQLLPGEAATVAAAFLGDLADGAGATAEILILQLAGGDDARRLDDAYIRFLAGDRHRLGHRLVGGRVGVG